MQLWRENAHILTSSAATCSLTSAYLSLLYVACALFIASHQGCNRVTQLSKSQQCMCMYRAQFPVTFDPESVSFANNLITTNVTKLLQGGMSTIIHFFLSVLQFSPNTGSTLLQCRAAVALRGSVTPPIRPALWGTWPPACSMMNFLYLHLVFVHVCISIWFCIV